MVDPCKPEPSVVIIGAGIAGLSAAQRLVQCGISNFTILEATDRPGGRIHSCWLGDVIAEMGCQYIEGACIGNPVYNLAAQEGLLKLPMKRTDPLKGMFCTSDGRAVGNSISMMAFHVFKQIESEAASLFHIGCGKEHGSLQNFFKWKDSTGMNVYLAHKFLNGLNGFKRDVKRPKTIRAPGGPQHIRIQQELQKFPEEHRYDASRIMYGLTNILRTKLGADLSQVSADNFGSEIEIPGGDVGVPLGFVGVLSPLMKELPDLGSLWVSSGGERYRAGIRDPEPWCSAAMEREYCADYVIITVSLGVLKEHGEKNVLSRLTSQQNGGDKKFRLRSRRKPGLREDFLGVVGRRQVRLVSDTGQENRLHQGRVEEVEGSKHVLCAFISGPEAVVMEHASDEEVAEGVTKVLRQFTGDASLPYPSTVLRSKWASDPYFCGSYSYMNMQSNIGHQCDLSCPVPGSCDPVPPILLFAGEATCAGHHSTVHGARLSGIREAERILQLTKKYSGPPPKDCA
ncbi:hypothetical protein NQ318_015199 [Aromia moschata]|uniref:Amine oxidase domain-containing protein n=1 Tax=Aromia moschata TaxID=1265417 RepID=A0AAV8XK48_9CUCU|nr:hypothetical protein NQ318_015199 [Aromia moschata]